MESTFEGGAKVIPISSIATIDDLITSLLKVGYQKELSYPKKYGTFFVHQCTGQKIPTVNTIILPKQKLDVVDEVYEEGDLCFGAFVNAKYYPHLTHWEVHECLGGSNMKLDWNLLENYTLENIDEIFKHEQLKWLQREEEDARK